MSTPRGSTTDTETINDPSWDDVREGDLVTFEKETSDSNKRVKSAVYARRQESGLFLDGNSPRRWANDGYRITKIVRETSVPAHRGALAFTDEGISFSDGNALGAPWWFVSARDSDDYVETAELKDPTEALPVPARQLRELLAAETDYDRLVAMNDLIYSTRREWERAGMSERLESSE